MRPTSRICVRWPRNHHPMALLLGSGCEHAVGFPENMAIVTVPLSLTRLDQLLAILVAEAQPVLSNLAPHAPGGQPQSQFYG